VLMREKRHVCVDRLFKMARLFTLPTPARQDAMFHGQGRSV
jgi:hypothetical protein